MVIKSLAYNKVIKYKQVATERIEDYRELVQELITEWRMILAIVSDWKRWVLWVNAKISWIKTTINTVGYCIYL